MIRCRSFHSELLNYEKYAQNREILANEDRKKLDLLCGALVAPAYPDGNCQLEKETAHRVDKDITQAWAA